MGPEAPEVQRHNSQTLFCLIIEVLTAAEFAGKLIEMLAAHRKELYERFG